MRELVLFSVVELSENDVKLLKKVLGKVCVSLRYGILEGREKYLCKEVIEFVLSPDEMSDLEEMIGVLEDL